MKRKPELPREDIYTVMAKQVLTRFNTIRNLKVKEGEEKPKTPEDAWKKIYSDTIESLKILTPSTVEALQLMEELGLYKHRYWLQGLLAIFEENANIERMRCLGYGLPTQPTIDKQMTTLQYPLPLIDKSKSST